MIYNREGKCFLLSFPFRNNKAEIQNAAETRCGRMDLWPTSDYSKFDFCFLIFGFGHFGLTIATLSPQRSEGHHSFERTQSSVTVHFNYSWNKRNLGSLSDQDEDSKCKILYVISTVSSHLPLVVLHSGHETKDCLGVVVRHLLRGGARVLAVVRKFLSVASMSTVSG